MAMGTGTALLPDLSGESEPAFERQEGSDDETNWPRSTAAAMRVGVEAALVAAVIEAARVAESRWVVLTGGDGESLHRRVAPVLNALDLVVAHRPLLCLESLASLRPPAG